MYFYNLSFRRHILFTYSAQLIAVGSTFLSTVMAARMLGASGQGELALFTQFSLWLMLLLSLGLPTACIHFIASGKLPREAAFSVLIRLLLLASVVLGVVYLSIPSLNFWKIFLPGSLLNNQGMSLVLIGYIMFLILNNFLNSIWQAERQFKHSAFFTSSGSVMLLILLLCRNLGWPGLEGNALYWIWGSMLFSQGAQALISLSGLWKRFPAYQLKSVTSKADIGPLFQYAFLAYATNSIQFLSYRMDTWFIHSWHGESTTGIYNLSVSLGQMLWLLPAAFQSVLYAHLSENGDHRLQRMAVVRSLKQIGLYALLAAAAGMILAFFLVPVLFGKGFSESVPLLGILLAGVMPFCLSMPVSAYFAASGKVIYNLHSAMIGFLVCLLADWLLIPVYSAYGAAWATVLSYNVTLGYLLYRFFNAGKGESL